MRYTNLILTIITLFLSHSHANSQEYYDQMDQFLEKYHSKSGLIDYLHIAKNDATLDSLYTIIGEMNLEEKDDDFLKAFYINTYNIIVIKQVVVFYPINNPFDVNGFFDNIMNFISGFDYTLDELEKRMIIPKFEDPRIHFALVCAAKGCPAIQQKAFRPETIEEELVRITKEVINNPYFVNYENDVLKLSKIFDWYGEEFTTEGSLIDYINTYRDEPVANTSSIEFNEYDWSLNDEK